MDDSYDILFENPDDVVELLVLANDYDPDGEPVVITDVSSSARGASVEIDPQGTSIHYQMPPDSPTLLEQGGALVPGEVLPEWPEDAQDTSDPGGFDPFEDTFEYTIADGLGVLDHAFCAVRKTNEPVWQMSLQPNYDSASEIGITGTPGYDLRILQVFGDGARGMTARPGNQTWQRNLHTAENVYLDAGGQLHYEKPGAQVLADTNRIVQNSQLSLRVTDRLAALPSPNAVETIFIAQTVAKKLGFNAAGKLLPVPTNQPWKPKAAEAVLLDTMRGPLPQTTTNYLFVAKARLSELHTQGKVSQQQLDSIKSAIQGQGLNWDNLPDTYERFSIANLGSWEYRP